MALDVPLARLFDYAVPETLSAQPGDRVVVPFGARQQLGVVIESDAASTVPESRMKPLAAVRDEAPRLTSEWLELMHFLSSYYHRPLGETVIASLPPRLRSVKPLPRKALAPAEGVASPQLVADASADRRAASGPWIALQRRRAGLALSFFTASPAAEKPRCTCISSRA